jgi:hypothetical protein
MYSPRSPLEKWGKFLFFYSNKIHIEQIYLNGRIRCPWHGACFSTETGDIEDFPGCGVDSLYTFKVALKGYIYYSNCKGDSVLR